VLLESGINIGDHIVVQGLVNMRDGVKVKDLAKQAQTSPVKQEQQ
jgi:hypothetical protein